MDPRMGAAPAPNQVFEDFVPKSELVTEADADILQIHLPDFKKEQLRVQVTRSGNLKISGQRPKWGDKWLRFHKEFPLSPNCIQNKISAKFERGILFVRQPKMIIAEKQLAAEPQKPGADEQRKAGEEPAKKTEEQAKGGATEPSQPPEQKTREEPSKKAEEQRKGETTASETKGKESEVTDAKTATEAKKSDEFVEDETINNKGLSDTRNAAMIENSGTKLATILRQPRRILNVALVVMVVISIFMYVNNMIRSSCEAEE
ncbi:inactive protein RESTRICTED TEV MOVEMENT 2 [Ipomoea triloba]|uniref:inactive protein RESTRICTED TEV MOVEMENT 2 n=1 Tax=Ipomoea triloba TaxID=35885 RepID=UPI00125DC100|nr:inactive protein RESTRICTED TEV MOVEMENT 2 [Ipomoea triloba]